MSVRLRHIPRGHELPLYAYFFQDVTRCGNSYQFRLAPNLMPWWGRYTVPCFDTSILQTAPFLDITLYNHRMSTPLQGASGPSGHAGSGLALGQPVVSASHIAPQPVLTRLKQVSPEQSTFREIRRLIVRLFTDPFYLRTNRLLGGTITPLKCYCHSARYVPVPPTKYPPDR